MALRDVDLAAALRVVPLRVRADLEVVAQPSPRGVRWTIKDPVAQRYWRLSEEESFLLRSLDGQTSADDLCARFAREFAPRRLTPPRLTAFLARLHDQGLVAAHRPGHSEAIFHREREWRRTAPLRALQRVLAWRFRGFDPDCWLGRVTPRLGWVFTTRFAALFVLLLVSAAVLVFIEWTALERELAALKGAFTADQALLVLAAIAIAKVLHELGHAIACKHFGGQCHELGLMLFVGFPSLYCNVSDAWMLPGKKPRILISAAGILVELAIAALCAWLWWWTYPGLMHSLALYALVVCSVNTLVLNGNPLLHYDGYYVLADLTDTPNLRAEARAAVRRLLARALLGVRHEVEGPSRGRVWLVLYGIASSLYRFVVVLGMAWFLHGVLEPYGAQFLSWIVGGLLAASLLIEPLSELGRFLRSPEWDRDVPWRWVAPRAGLFFIACLSLMLIPLPASVVAPVVLEPRDMRFVYVEVEGRLVWAIALGAHVQRGDVVARLESLPLATELARFAGERDAMQLRLTNLRRRQSDPEAAAQIPTAAKSLTDVEERLRQRQRDFERLVIRAPRSGVVLPPAARKTESQSVPTWVGAPLDPENLGCELRTGDVLCVIGEPQKMDAVVYVAQGDEELVQTGQRVELFVDSFPHRRPVGAVTVPPTSRADEAPEELLIRGELPMDQDYRGKARSKQPLFTARVELTGQESPLLIGGTGRAKVAVGPRSIAGRIWRSLRQTLRDS